MEHFLNTLEDLAASVNYAMDEAGFRAVQLKRSVDLSEMASGFL